LEISINILSIAVLVLAHILVGIHIHFGENAYESANGLNWFRIGSMAGFCEYSLTA
jgi:hypothetical protein